MMITIQMIQVHVDHGDDQNDNYDQVRLAFRTLDKDGMFLMMLIITKKRMIMNHDDNNPDDPGSC